MGASGFEDLVIQELGGLTDKVEKLAGRVGELNLSVVTLNENQKRSDERQKALMGPLTDWTLSDSLRLKKIIDREAKREGTSEEQASRQTVQDRLIGRWRDYAVLVGAMVGLFAGLGLRITDVVHSLGRWTGITH